MLAALYPFFGHGWTERLGMKALPRFPRGGLYTLSVRGRSLVSVLDQLEVWAKAGVAHDRTN